MTAIQTVPVLDMSLSPVEILVAKYNAINGLNINPNDVTLSSLTIVDSPNYNTFVELIPIASSIWLTRRPLYYRRVALPEALQVPAEVRTAGNEYLYQILDAVNAAYGTNFKQADIEEATIQYSDPQDRTSPGTVMITARPSSYFYTASQQVTVNTPHKLGNNLYENELAYIVVENDTTTGLDSLKVINNQGDPINELKLLTGLQVNSLSVSAAWVLPDLQVLMIGTFSFQENGAPKIYRSLVLDSRGNVISRATGNVFGTQLAGLRYTLDPTSRVVYALDPNNAIGGRASRLHRYLSSGVYDTSFPNISDRQVISVAVDNDRLYALTFEGTTLEVICVKLSDGTPVAGWTKAVITGTKVTNAAQLIVDSLGVRVCMELDYTSRAPITINGVSIAQPGELRHNAAFAFDKNGVLRVDWKTLRTPLWSQITRITPATAIAQDMSFHAQRTDSSSVAYPKFEVVALDIEGLWHRPTHGEFGIRPNYQEIPQFFACPNADILAVGKVLVEDNSQTGLKTVSSISVYASTGRFGAMIYQAPSTVRIKAVLTLMGDSDA